MGAVGAGKDPQFADGVARRGNGAGAAREWAGKIPGASGRLRCMGRRARCGCACHEREPELSGGGRGVCARESWVRAVVHHRGCCCC